MLVLYQEHYGVRYAPRGLASLLFYAICLLAVLVLPFIIGLAMQNFWVETNSFYEMPQVTFTGNCALRVHTLLGKEYLWTCSELFNEALQGTALQLVPYFAVYEDDKDGDGKVDAAHFVVNFPLGDATAVSLYANTSGSGVEAPTAQRDTVLEVYFLPEFVYHINHYLVKVNMTAAPLLRYQRSSPPENLGSVTTVVGSRTSASSSGVLTSNVTLNRWSGAPICAVTKADMLFHTTHRLINSPYVSYMHTYTSSPLEQRAQQPADLLDLSLFSGYYTARNQSVVLRPTVEAAGGLNHLHQDGIPVRGLWGDLDDLNAFTWYVELRILPAEVPYVPSYAEVLKWAWVQYFVIAYTLQWFLWQIRGLLVKLGLFTTRATFSTMRRQY